MDTKIVKNKYKSFVSYSEFSTASIFKIFSNYFNNLYFDKKKQLEDSIDLQCIIKDNNFSAHIELEERYGSTVVLIKYNDVLINMLFEVYKQNNEVYFHLSLDSIAETYIDGVSFYKNILRLAIENSKLKGGIFSMPRNELEWKNITMPKKDFNDIFLPKSNIEDLKLYIDVGLNLEYFMRFLMVGNPGTGKTEATTVIANLLNQQGVTIIKTSVCDKIKEKFELASLLEPSIMILDDIDLSLGSRNKGVYSERLQDFLDILDGTEKLSKKVGVIATTNSTALLDMASQRPGRFDKFIFFEKLTKDNIKNIILKSLKDNFKIKSASNNIVSVMTDPLVINHLYSKGTTGAYIYNITKMLKLKIDMSKKQINLDVNWILGEMESNLKTIDKLRNTDFLGDKLNNGQSGGIGFNSNEDEEEEEEDDDEYEYVDEECPAPPLDQYEKNEIIESIKERLSKNPSRRKK